MCSPIHKGHNDLSSSFLNKKILFNKYYFNSAYLS